MAKGTEKKQLSEGIIDLKSELKNFELDTFRGQIDLLGALTGTTSNKCPECKSEDN